MSPRPTVLLFGGSGITGGSIVDALLARNEFKVKVAIRPSSEEKSSVVDLKRRGVEIVLIDIASASLNELVEVLTGVDTVISTLVHTQLGLQYGIIDAAVSAGVKRVVPCDFGTPGLKGKLDIRDYVRKSEIGYTFIDIGFWYQYHLTEVKPEQAYVPFLWETSRFVYNGGTVKTSYTDLGDIGKFTARIVADPRTLNQYVFAWGEEVTQQDLASIAEEVSGEKPLLISKTTEDLLKLIAEAKETRSGLLAYWEYHYSTWILGENTKENAVKPEFGSALDARQLYPDFVVHPLREHAVEHYLHSVMR
ncbi:NAD-P-binding protein [Mycena crocata]|nr:NAD-P-binding protein [Mycena crocata]